ncbi:MAG TPA: AMP-binding protein, partial [Anaeromyxobacteraceae bacterium]|nr:AMP-binding protein [Anaeromyxobacteraceae bacterium]
MSQGQAEALLSVPFRYFLDRHKVERGGAVAVVDGLTGESITYAELHDRVSRIGGWLLRNGVGHGDRVACLALNAKGHTEFLLALSWIGAVAVPLNMRLNPRELRFIIDDSGARAIFTDGKLVELAQAAIAGTAAVGLRILDGPSRDGWTPYGDLTREDAPPAGPDGAVTGHTLFMLLYTSGTTGEPKGCMIPQRSWTGYATNMATCFRMGPEDVYLAFLPYFHVAGFGTAFSQLILGGTIVTAPLPDPKLFYRLIARHRVTFMFLVPGISSAFVHDETRKETDVSSLRVFISGAGLEKPDLPDVVERTLGARYFGIYGQTESGSKITWATADMIRSDPSTYGHVMPFFDYRIVDEEDRELPPGRVGELCIRGDTVMAGYWKRPEATAETLRGDWHHTGDLFVVTPTGQVRMVDRKKYLIKTGGENVYPQEVELVLLRHPAIADAAVVGIRDDRWGEAVKAFVVLKEGASPTRREIADFVGESIAGYKKPRAIAFTKSIPRNA